MRRRTLAFALLLPVITRAQAQPPQRALSLDRPSTRVSRATLDSVTERGRFMAAYDAVAWHATDAVLALKPADGTVNMYLARPLADGRWEAVFGRYDGVSDTFLVGWRAQQRAVGDTIYTVNALATAAPEQGYFLRAARALDRARSTLGQPQRPYNAVVMPIASGGWYVYFVPAQVRAGYYPLGGDTRFRMDAEGRTILERRQMHNTIVELGPPGPPPPGATEWVAMSHTAVVADMVEDSDVFHVLVRKPARPEWVQSASFLFVIDVRGRIEAYER